MYVQQLVVRCQRKMAAAYREMGEGWCADYAADVSLLLLALFTHHALLKRLVLYGQLGDVDGIRAAAELAQRWIDFTGDLVEDV